MNPFPRFAENFEEFFYDENDLMYYPELIISSTEMSSSSRMNIPLSYYRDPNVLNIDMKNFNGSMITPYYHDLNNDISVSSDLNILDLKYLDVLICKPSDKVLNLFKEETNQTQPKTELESLLNNDVQLNKLDESSALNVTALNRSEKIKKKRGRKYIETGMKKRKDVVLKTILRKIRKIIRRRFYNYWKFFKSKTSRNLNTLREQIKGYICKNIEENPSNSFVETFGMFILTEYVEGMINQINNPDQKKYFLNAIVEIRKALYKFSYARFLDMLNLPGMCDIILHFERTQDSKQLNSDEYIGFKVLSKECIRKQLNCNKFY